eukprot:11550922-Alexandrium_andersonii.AAC.1
MEYFQQALAACRISSIDAVRYSVRPVLGVRVIEHLPATRLDYHGTAVGARVKLAQGSRLRRDRPGKSYTRAACLRRSLSLIHI